MPAKPVYTSIRVSEKIARELHDKKEKGDSYDDVLKREIMRDMVERHEFKGSIAEPLIRIYTEQNDFEENTETDGRGSYESAEHKAMNELMERALNDIIEQNDSPIWTENEEGDRVLSPDIDLTDVEWSE